MRQKIVVFFGLMAMVFGPSLASPAITGTTTFNSAACNNDWPPDAVAISSVAGSSTFTVTTFGRAGQLVNASVTFTSKAIHDVPDQPNMAKASSTTFTVTPYGRTSPLENASHTYATNKASPQPDLPNVTKASTTPGTCTATRGITNTDVGWVATHNCAVATIFTTAAAQNAAPPIWG